MKKTHIILFAGILLYAATARAQVYNQDLDQSFVVRNYGTYNDLALTQAKVATARYYALEREKNRTDFIDGDFGTVKQGESIITFFVIPAGELSGATGGNVNLYINKVYADAESGITFVSPVPNQSIVEMGFDSGGKSGKINELVTVYTTSGTYYLRLRGIVKQ